MFINYAQYRMMADIKLGRREPDPLFAELIGWIRDGFDLPVVYLIPEITENPGKCTLLRMFLETQDDITAITPESKTRHIDFKYKDAILTYFLKLVRKYRREDEFYLDRVQFTVWNFDVLAREDAHDRASQEIREHIRREYAGAPIHDVYTMFGLCVFYEKDYQVAESQGSGLSGMIKADYYRILKKYDEFDLFTPENIEVAFDSHENVENNYQGNYYYYFK